MTTKFEVAVSISATAYTALA